MHSAATVSFDSALDDAVQVNLLGPGRVAAALRVAAPISFIHDSVLCRATDMGILSSIVRETYMHLFAEHDFLTSFAQQIGAETAPPMIGDLQPESVIESTYFFC